VADAGATAPSTVAVLVTPVATPEPLAATCAMAKVAVDVVPSTVGALAVCRETAGTRPRDAAVAVSTLLKGVPVVLLRREGGHVEASRWLDGEEGDPLAAGLVLSGAPEVLEDLVLGSVTADQVSGMVSSVGLSRLRAMRMLAASARANRR
jgi:hypothetical protein